jgi:hypothetical protein
MSDIDTRRLRLDLILQSIRLCPREFILAASLYPSSDSPISVMQGMMEGADQSAVSVAREAAARIQIRDDQNVAAVAKQLGALLGRPQPGSLRSMTEVERRDADDLAKMAAGQRVRTGERQDILVLGIFIMWVANRAALNSAFESVPLSQKWLRPFPPSIVMIAGDGGQDSRDFESSVIAWAQANDGPVDKWYRRFKIEQ